MTGKILKSILIVAATVLLACLLVITGVLYQYFSAIQHEQLKDELSLAAEATESLGESYLEELPAESYRFTLIAADGKVLFDSLADSEAMDNHADREEIQEARATGSGSSSRYSSTVTERTFYEAVLLEDGSVLRISVSRETVAALLIDLIYPMVLIAALAMLLSAWLAHRMAKRVVEPLNRLDLEKPMENDAYEELSPLLRRIHAQHQEIDRQLKTLRQKQDEFDQITFHMKEALVLLDNEGRIVSINPAARLLFDASPSRVGEDFLTADRSRDISLAVSDARENGHAEFRANIDNREYQFDLSRIESDDSVHGVVLLAFDVTEQMNAERSRREFTANVSHELKTPLQSIIGSAELMENGIVKSEDMPDFVGRIRRDASRLVKLIEDIIGLSQLEERNEMPQETVSLRALSEEVREVLSSSAEAKQVSLEVSGDEGTISGVRRLLYEVIYNLCDNAIKYNKTGGSVNIRIAEDSEKVKLTVEDTGIGVAPEEHTKIFERFYRVDKSHSRLSGGTGLGLSIVKHAVRRHHGKIDISSEPGKGTAITVTLFKDS